MSKSDYFLINKSKFLPLSKASHNVGLNNRKVSNKNPSQWVWSFAMLGFKEGQRVSTEEVAEALNKAQLEEAIAMALEDGMLDMTFSEEKNDFVFFLTEKGRNHVDKL